MAGFIEFLVHLKAKDADGKLLFNGGALGQKFSRVLILSFSMVAVSVPEGLPLAVTLSLSFATQKMTKAALLVRNLKSCETMGHATVVLTDKTGTLTQNAMTVVGMILGNGSIRAGVKSPPLYDNGEPCAPEVNDERSLGPLFSTHIDPYWRHILKELIAFNSTAQEIRNYTDVTYLGSSTEVALLRFAQSYLGLGYLDAEKGTATVANVFPFDSRKKCMGVVVLENDGRYRVFIKGSPEAVLARCTKINRDPRVAPDASSEPLSSGNLKQIKNVVDAYASMSLRMLGLAYADLEQLPEPKTETGRVEFDQIFHDLTWLGAAAIQDPLRDEVPRAISDCERAGVRVIMVTGDNKSTAESIARSCGILKHDGLVIEGAELRGMSAVERKNATKSLCVVARCLPEDKKLLVEAFRDRSYIVAVTGDGTNDGPALKAAHVGFSMGKSGTDIAKEASDIILMNDDFTGIVEALKWGRCINDSVKKFLQFQLSVNVIAAAFTIITYFADLSVPLTAANATVGHTPVITSVQLLWVNLIMDTLAALALATDQPDEHLLDRPAESWKASLISPSMFRLMGLQLLFQLPLLCLIWFGRSWWELYSVPAVANRDVAWRTFLFNVFVFMQITNCVNSRSLTDRKNVFTGVLKNPWFIGSWLIMLVGQIIIVSFGSTAFNVYRLSGPLWGITLAFSLLPLLIGVTSRMVPERYFTPWRYWQRRGLRLSALARRPATIEQGRFPDMWKDISEAIKDDLTFHRRLRGGRSNRIAAALVAPSIMASAPAGP
jgi:Ca2+-transporting ATPase